jgi:four helix bundle protein
VTKKNYMDVEDLEVSRKLCQLHIEVCELTYPWPQEEKYELESLARRSSKSAPAQLAEKNDDRHIRNKIEGVNRSRGEAGETIHHLYIAQVINRVLKAGPCLRNEISDSSVQYLLFLKPET